MYNILPYTQEQALMHNVIIYPSRLKNKKIDIYNKDGYYIASVGGMGYKDYPTYVLEDGEEYANTRRELYQIRHRKNILRQYSPAWWSNALLW